MTSKLYNMSVLLFIYSILGCITFRFEDTLFIYGTVAITLFLSFVVVAKQKGIIHWGKYNSWYIIVNLYWVISIIWSIDKRKYFEILNPYILLIFITMVLVTIYLRDYQCYGKLLRYIVIAAVAAGIRCIAATDISSILVYYNREMFAAKLLTQGVNYNYFTTGFALAAVIAFYLAYIKKIKIFYLAYFFLTIVCTISGSRKSIIISVLAGILFLLFHKRDTKLVKKLSIIILIFIIVCVLIFKIPTLYHAVGEIMEDLFRSLLGLSQDIVEPSIIEREFFKKKAWEIFFDNPIIGVGANNYSAVLQSINYDHAVYAHNNFLEILADGGLIGFFIYYSFYAYNLFIALSRYKRNKYSDETILVLVFIISLLIMEYGQITYMNPSAQLIFMSVITGYSRFEHTYSNHQMNLER